MIAQQEKQTIQNTLAPFAPERIGIFGSVARGEATAESDMDILVAFSKPLSLFDLVNLEQQLTTAFGRKVDLVTEGALHPRIKKYVERDIIYL